jgi:hypothetical protein
MSKIYTPSFLALKVEQTVDIWISEIMLRARLLSLYGYYLLQSYGKLQVICKHASMRFSFTNLAWNFYILKKETASFPETLITFCQSVIHRNSELLYDHTQLTI